MITEQKEKQLPFHMSSWFSDLILILIIACLSFAFYRLFFQDESHFIIPVLVFSAATIPCLIVRLCSKKAIIHAISVRFFGGLAILGNEISVLWNSNSISKPDVLVFFTLFAGSLLVLSSIIFFFTFRSEI